MRPGISMGTASLNSTGTHAFCHSVSILPSGEVQHAGDRTDPAVGGCLGRPRRPSRAGAGAATVPECAAGSNPPEAPLDGLWPGESGSASGQEWRWSERFGLWTGLSGSAFGQVVVVARPPARGLGLSGSASGQVVLVLRPLARLVVVLSMVVSGGLRPG